MTLALFFIFSFNLPRPHPYPPKKESCDCHKWQKNIKMPLFCKYTCCLLDIWLVPGRRSLWGGGDAGKVGPRGMAPWPGLAKRMEVEARLKGDSQIPPTVLICALLVTIGSRWRTRGNLWTIREYSIGAIVKLRQSCGKILRLQTLNVLMFAQK